MTTIPRFFLAHKNMDAAQLNAWTENNLKKTILISEPTLINQVRNVLRLKPGSPIVLLDGQGFHYDIELIAVGQSNIECKVLAKRIASGNPLIYITVGLALIKGDRFEWALQKMTELGVSAIVPLVSERTVIKIKSKTSPDAKQQINTASNKLARWQAILQEASEQSERGTIPQIVNPLEFNTYINKFAPSQQTGLSLLCLERLNKPLLKDILHDENFTQERNFTGPKNISIAIGPEGGFTEREIEFACRSGWHQVSLGPRILRSETAAIYALGQTIWTLEK